MSITAAEFLSRLAVSSCFLAVTTLAIRFLLNRLQIRTSAVHTAVWTLALLQGFILAQCHVEIPWYEPQDNPIRLWAGPQAEVSQARGADSAETRALPVQQSNITDWSGYALFAWALVCGLILCCWCADYLRFVFREDSHKCDRDEWNAEWETVNRDSRVAAAIPLHISQNVGPLLYRRPFGYRVVVPYRLWTSVTASQRKLILRHELAHFERCDVWWSLLANLAALPHWFNPLAWYAARRLEQSLEWACDDKTRVFGDQQQTDYASTLLALGEYSAASTPKFATAIDGSELGGRIRRLLSNRRDGEKLSSRTLVVLAALTFIGIHLFRVDLVAQQTKGDGGLTDAHARLALLSIPGERILDPSVLSQSDADRLTLIGPLITDDELKRLADRTDLRSLRLFDTKVKGPGLRHLSSLNGLEQLVLAGPHVTDDWLESLPRLSGLRRMTISQTNVTTVGLQHLRRFPKLRTLDLRYSDFGDEALAVLEHLPNLRALYLGHTHVGDKTLARLRFTPKLTQLELKHTQVTDQGLRNLSHVPNLRYFSLASPHVKGPGTANLKYTERLQELQFVGENVSDVWLHSIPTLKALYWFQLHSTSVTSAGLKPVGSWTKLEDLYLTRCPAIEDDVTAPPEWPQPPENH